MHYENEDKIVNTFFQCIFHRERRRIMHGFVIIHINTMQKCQNDRLLCHNVFYVCMHYLCICLNRLDINVHLYFAWQHCSQLELQQCDSFHSFEK